MKKNLVLLSILGLMMSVSAFEYTPKTSNPFGSKYTGGKAIDVKQNLSQTQKTVQNQQSEMREIKTLAEYFRYLPAEVHRHWTPYKAETDYEIAVQFVVHRDGSISGTKIVGTNYPAANAAVLNAVKSGAPYQPLPKSYVNDSVKAQIVLEYRAKKD